MKILNRKEFLALEGQHVFAKYSPQCCEDICIKMGNSGENDFYYQDLSPYSAIECTGCQDRMDQLDEMENNSSISTKMDYWCIGRDGCYDNEQLFMVLSKQDVGELIDRLDLARDNME